MSFNAQGLSVAEQLLLSTFRLHVAGENEEWTATGFVYRVDYPSGQQSDLLVTCAHVLEGAQEITIQYRENVGEDSFRIPKIVSLTFPLISSVVIYHPAVDLAAIFLQPLFAEYNLPGRLWPAMLCLGKSHLADFERIDVAQEILMVGCPLDIYDRKNNLPIFRRGITSSHPSFDYEGKPHFIVDVAANSGSSGSPILSFALTEFNREESRYDLFTVPQIHFLGILMSGLDEIAENDEEGRHGHLGVAIRADQLLWFDKRAHEITGIKYSD